MTAPPQPVILASRSPRRIELLKEVVPHFKVIPSSADEIFDDRLSPSENAVAIARSKALEVSRKYPGHWVIGADTIVVLENEIIGKPKDADDACAILRRLSGKVHQVITGVVIVNGEPVGNAVTSKVVFHPLTDAVIHRYVETGEPLDKAGAYAIQGKGAFMIASYSGSYSNIVGLPLEELKNLLQQAGYDFS